MWAVLSCTILTLCSSAAFVLHTHTCTPWNRVYRWRKSRINYKTVTSLSRNYGFTLRLWFRSSQTQCRYVEVFSFLPQCLPLKIVLLVLCSHAHYLSIIQLQWLRMVLSFYLVETPRIRLFGVLPTFHLRLVRFLGQLLPTHTLHMSKSLRNFPIPQSLIFSPLIPTFLNPHSIHFRHSTFVP